MESVLCFNTIPYSVSARRFRPLNNKLIIGDVGESSTSPETNLEVNSQENVTLETNSAYIGYFTEGLEKVSVPSNTLVFDGFDQIKIRSTNGNVIDLMYILKNQQDEMKELYKTINILMKMNLELCEKLGIEPTNEIAFSSS